MIPALEYSSFMRSPVYVGIVVAEFMAGNFSVKRSTRLNKLIQIRPTNCLFELENEAVVLLSLPTPTQH